jgi:D-amino-acid dehydrogenase
MRVLVLGAGVVGIATAYFLNRAGHEVLVVDRAPGPGLETSFANGGQISASHAEPWASPGTLRRLPGWLGRADAPLLFRPRWDPALWEWGIHFLRNCLPGRTHTNSERILRMAVYSREVLRQLCAEETSLAFDRKRQGILQFFRSDKDFAAGIETARLMKEAGCDCQVLGIDECLQLEPALRGARSLLRGGVYTPDDESGDAYKFTAGLAELLAGRGVEFRYGTEVTGLRQDKDRIVGADTAAGPILADRTVVALGSYSARLLAQVGVRVLIYPAKGYSATLCLTEANAAAAPNVSLIDEGMKIVYSRLGDRLRVAGTAEFVGHDTRMNARRADLTLRSALEVFPALGPNPETTFWTGLRPSTPDGVPVVGETRLPGLLLNTGHGTLGWTMSCGSGQTIADIVSGKAPAIDLTGFGAERF